MVSPDYFKKLFEYDYWGNREALASLSSVTSNAERPLKLMGHTLGAQRLWLARLERQDVSTLQPWPDLSLSECQAAVENIHQRWRDYLAKVAPDELSEAVIYHNTKGAEFRNPVVDILQQVIMHSAYHRGQVAAAVREAGGKPARTDYIAYVRQNSQK